MTTTDFFRLPDEALAVTIQSDGRIVAAGEATTNDQQSLMGFVRYNLDGTLDTSFGQLGKQIAGFFGSVDQANSVVVLPSGAILAGGSATQTNGDQDFALVQLTARGVPDSTFGHNGEVTTDFSGGADSIKQVLLESDGKIIVAGYATNGSETNFAVARYNSDGSADTGFGTSGKSTVSFSGVNSRANAAALQSDGNIVLAGFAGDPNDSFDFALARIQGGPGADFSLAVASPSVTVQRRSRDTLNIQINRVGGFTGDVTVTAPSNFPSGVKLISSSSVQTSGTTAQFTIKVKKAAQPGSTPLVFTGTDSSGQTHTVQLTLIIQ